MAWYRRREVNLILTAIPVVILLLDYFFGVLTPQSNALQNLVLFIFSFAAGVGVVNITKKHVRWIQTRAQNLWTYSIMFLILFWGTLIIGLIPPIGANDYVRWLYSNFYGPVQTSFGAMIAVFYCQAVYRAFKVRNLDGLLLMIGAVFTMLKNVPLGSAIWGGFPIIGDWILHVPVTGVFRGVTIGVGIGVVALSVRTILGYEKTYLRISEEE